MDINQKQYSGTSQRKKLGHLIDTIYLCYGLLAYQGYSMASMRADQMKYLIGLFN